MLQSLGAYVWRRCFDKPMYKAKKGVNHGFNYHDETIVCKYDVLPKAFAQDRPGESSGGVVSLDNHNVLRGVIKRQASESTT